MSKIILASSNLHKLEEMNNLFKSDLFSLEGALEKLEVIEDGETFHENALIKARAYTKKFKMPALADDSGLVVESLPGELGIKTARFGGDGLTDQGRYELLLEKLNGQNERQAYFVCVLCFYFSDKEYYFFEGRLKGEILESSSGNQGFGYDPVFAPEAMNAKSLAELPDWKMKNSHRAIAFEHANKFFKNYPESIAKP